MSLITIIDLLFRLYIIIIRKSWFEGLRGGLRGLAKNRFRTDSIRYLTILASIWIDTRYRVFLPSLPWHFPFLHATPVVFHDQHGHKIARNPENLGTWMHRNEELYFIVNSYTNHLNLAFLLNVSVIPKSGGLNSEMKNPTTITKKGLISIPNSHIYQSKTVGAAVSRCVSPNLYLLNGPGSWIYSSTTFYCLILGFLLHVKHP